MKFVISLLISMVFVPAAIGQRNEDKSELSAPQDELVSLCREMYSAFEKHRSHAKTLKDDAERKKYLSEHDPSARFVHRLEEFAQKYHGSHAGLMALRRLVLLGAGGGERNNPRDLGRRSALLVLIEYGESPELPEIIRYLEPGNAEPAVEPFLRKLIASKNASDDNRVFAQYMLARWSLAQLNAREYWERRLKELDTGADWRSPTERSFLQASLSGALSPEKLRDLEQEALVSLETLSNSQTDARQPGIEGVDKKNYIIRVDAEKTKLMPLVTELAAGLLFKQKHLQVGRPAPNLDVSLVGGDRWSLAMQLGKTVIIQFSFKGCVPCERMYPDLKTMKDAYPNSLSILSIMTDEDKSDTEEAVQSGKLEWNVFWDGQSGMVATQWGVKGFPTVYVVGPDGKIAANGLRGDLLKSKIAELANPALR